LFIKGYFYKMKKKLVVLSGAGVSAESGLKTFRDYDGLWENHRIEDVATIDARHKDPALVQNFYNARRAQAALAKPNEAHVLIAKLEEAFDVSVITQNVDHLHEMAGSGHVLHLHGSLFDAKSTRSASPVFRINGDIKMGDLAPDGYQLRPNIVWFGEEVPQMAPARAIVEQAAIFVVIGTSMQVYPAAGLVDYVPKTADIYCIDLHLPQKQLRGSFIQDTATAGMLRLYQMLLS
jgi:NAD-dependent deacetylase